jgi:dipeptidyl-peptidase-4
VVDVARGRFVDTHSTLRTPPTVTVGALPGSAAAAAAGAASPPPVLLHDAGAADPRVAALAPAPPRLATLPSADGAVTLQAAVYEPDAAVHGPGPWPLIVAPYGGPHVMVVTDSWGVTADLRAQFLRAQGFCVLKV